MLRALWLIMVAVVLAGCGATGADEAQGPPEGDPYIHGTITHIAFASPATGEDTGVATVLIEAADGSQASLNVTGDTPIWETFGGGFERSRHTRLGEGQTVSAWVSGPVAESSPPQADADAIVITVE